MLKKMRWRFIAAAMSAITAVMLLLALCINLWNYFVTIERMNETILGLMESEQVRPAPKPQKKYPPKDFFGKPSPEAPYMMRYFSVHLDNQDRIVNIRMDFVSSVSEQEAREYTADILKKRKNTGFYREYRYVLKKTENGTSLFFLNVSKELQFMKILLFISCLVAFISLIVVFFLVFIFSKRAIRPFMDNISRQKKFITDASHEIKTPLTSIAASAEVLAMEEEDNEWVKNIQNQTKRLSKLTADLITLSRLDEEEPFPEKNTFSFSDAVWEAIEPFDRLFEVKNKRFLYQIKDGLMFYGDKAAIQQMFSILLDNALKYSGENGWIRLSVRKKHRTIVVELQNSCQSKEILDADRLFDRFYRPDESRSLATGGHGIGLSIAQAIVRAHNGSISAHWEQEGSIRFRILL